MATVNQEIRKEMEDIRYITDHLEMNRTDLYDYMTYRIKHLMTTCLWLYNHDLITFDKLNKIDEQLEHDRFQIDYYRFDGNMKNRDRSEFWNDY